MQENLFPQWLFEDRLRQGRRLLPDWQSYLAGSSKSHREISISCIFLQSLYQLDMKNIVKSMVERTFLRFTYLLVHRVRQHFCSDF